MASVARSARRRRHIEGWKVLPWREIERNVFRLQRRIYRASRRGNWKRVHNLQRLLLRSWSARCLAVRRVSQDNRGKRTPGVDGVASLTPKQRMALAEELRNLSDWTTDPIRRTYIPKPGTNEKRALGIATMRERAMETLVKLALEPEWEAKFEPNSYGFRPGRSTHDAIEAIFNHIRLKPKFIYDTDIEKCFDHIDWQALLTKLNTIRPIARLVRLWLRAGIVDKGEMLFPKEGVPQGSPLSPLLCNVALHGLEEALEKVAVIRYADDLAIISPDLETLLKAKERADEWLAEVGLRLKPSKSRVTHTLEPYEGNVGFDFLGFQVRQYPVGKYRTRTYRGKPGFKTIIKPSPKAIKRHQQQIGDIVRKHRGNAQEALIAELNPVIWGWALYHRTSVAKRVFTEVDMWTFERLTWWARRRHPHKSWGWRYRRYWRKQKDRVSFSDGDSTLVRHEDTPIQRHVKVRGDKSPYDGDWPYWMQRQGRDPTKPIRVTRLFKRQEGRCMWCGSRFTAEDIVEVHHWDGDRSNNRYANLVLLHGHCHDQLHAEGVYDKDPRTEERSNGKLLRSVREWHWAGRPAQRP
jgi:RNA-directed DNA polymerase